MKTFGPLHLLWEEVYQGEGYLRIMEQHTKMGLRGNWKNNILYNVMKKNHLNM